jgi:hypothetical protein
MTQSIGGYGSGDWNRWRDEADTSSTVEQAAYRYCRNADSVISGALCGEPKVISDACRAGKSDIDKTLCDDKQLKAAQDGVWQTTKDLPKMIFGGIVGKAGK